MRKEIELIKLNINHHKYVIDLFGDEMIQYRFIISDLLRNNYSGVSFQVYGEFADNDLKSILLNNQNNLTYFSKDDRSIELYMGVLKEMHFHKISGAFHLVEKFIPFYNVKSDGLCYLGYFDTIAQNRKHLDMEIKYITSNEELGLLYYLLMSVKEYHNAIPSNKSIYIQEQKQHINDNTRTAYIFINNKMISSSSTVNEYTNSAIITGVITSLDYRKLGYGSDVLIDLVKNLLKEGKVPYLFYNNPAARNMYLKLGIKEVCEWRVCLIDS